MLKPPHRDRGSWSAYAVVTFAGLMLLVGLVVDGGAKIQATERAEAVAREAARAGGQAVQSGAAMRGTGAYADAAAARAAATSYLDAAGVTGTVTVVDGQTVQVTATGSAPTVFLNIVGIGEVSGTGEAEARIARVVAGQEG